MKNYIVFGDVHGRMDWERIVKSNWDRDVLFVFLGDYVSTHEGISGEDQMKVLDAVLTFKEKNPDRVTLLRGNHDMQHLGYDWGECSGYNHYVGREMSKVRDRYLKDTQWILYDAEQKICFSHAGITNTWLKDAGVDLEHINELEPSELFGFRPSTPWDIYGDTVTQPLTWVRPSALAMDTYGAPELTHVVGHTTWEHIRDTWELLTKLRENNPKLAMSHIWLCDTMPREYLEIFDGQFIVKKF